MNKDIKNILKNSIITSLIVFVYGILIMDKIVYIGMFIGSLISVAMFYNMYLEAEAVVRSPNAFKFTMISYMKRYVIYGVYLTILMKLFGTPGCIAGGIGLLNIKANILMSTLATFLRKLVDRLRKINEEGR